MRHYRQRLASYNKRADYNEALSLMEESLNIVDGFLLSVSNKDTDVSNTIRDISNILNESDDKEHYLYKALGDCLEMLQNLRTIFRKVHGDIDDLDVGYYYNKVHDTLK